MGEEQCGLDALRIAHARIASGQTDIFLVGGSYNAERADLLLVYELGGFLWKGPFARVWDRAGQGRRLHPRQRRRLSSSWKRASTPTRAGPSRSQRSPAVAADRTKRRPGDVAASLERMWKEVGAGADTAVLSGATGVKGITEEEQATLGKLHRRRSRARSAIVVGHTMEPQTAGRRRARARPPSPAGEARRSCW